MESASKSETDEERRWDDAYDHPLQVQVQVNGATFDVIGKSRGIPSQGESLAYISTEARPPAGFDMTLLAFVLLTGNAIVARVTEGSQNVFRSTSASRPCSRSAGGRHPPRRPDPLP